MSSTRTRLSIAAGVLAAGAMSAIVPAAHAATGGDTPVTFQIAGTGSLSISVPGTTANIGTLSQAVLGTGNFTGSGPLGTTTVSDTRGGIAVTDTVTATSAGFTGANTAKSLPASDASISSGLVTFGGGMVAAAGLPAGTDLSGGGQQVMLGVTTGTGTASYNPTLAITVPPTAAIADTYNGTVTQTVS